MYKELTTSKALCILYSHEDLLGGHDDYWEAYRFIEKHLKALEIIKRLLNEDCTSDLLHILHTYNKWEDYVYACDYNDENLIFKSKEEFNLLKEILR